MLNRRAFFCSCFALHYSLRAGAKPSQSAFVCSTMDPHLDAEQGADLSLYSVDANLPQNALYGITKEFELTPYGTANYAHRWRRSDGLTPNTGMITLGVHFLNGEPGLWQLVEQSARGWLTGEAASRIDFRFGVAKSSCQISIMFGTGRNNSIVGRESAKYARSQATMNLTDFDIHVIAHEFGHALGLQHEHQNPSAEIKWNKPIVIAEMASHGWSPQDCERNIFSRFSRQYACVGSPEFDGRSIMLYPIPTRWTLDHYSASTNAFISTKDRACITGLYRA